MADSALEELEMDAEGVEGIANLMGNSGGKLGEGGNFVGLARLLGRSAILGNIAQENGASGGIGAIAVEVDIYDVKL